MLSREEAYSYLKLYLKDVHFSLKNSGVNENKDCYWFIVKGRGIFEIGKDGNIHHEKLGNIGHVNKLIFNRDLEDILS